MKLETTGNETKSATGSKAMRLANSVAGWLPPVRKILDDSAQKYSRVARTYYEDGEDELAIANYEKALARAPKDLAIANDLAQVYYENERVDEAESLYRRVLEEDYTNQRALKGLAFSLHLKGNIEEAIYVYLKCLTETPDDYDVLLNLGALFIDSGDDEKAIEFSQRASKVEPTLGTPHQNLASAYFNLGRFSEAEASIRRALELERNDESLRILGLVLETQGRTDEALESYEQAIVVNPENAQVHLEMARLLDELGRYSDYLAHSLKAVEVFKAQSFNDGVAAAYWEVGWAYYQLGDWEKSADGSRKALELQPDLPAPRFNLGLALLQMGKPDAAKEEYRTGMKHAKPVDLKNHAIDDLETALAKNPQIKGAHEILDFLVAEYSKISQQWITKLTQS